MVVRGNRLLVCFPAALQERSQEIGRLRTQCARLFRRDELREKVEPEITIVMRRAPQSSSSSSS